MNKRNISLILIGLFLGATVGGLIGNLMTWMLPEGVVKDFFLTSISFNFFGQTDDADKGVVVLDLSIIILKIGLSIKFNFASIIGLSSAYYMLRYFR
jgi:hypothetical protein